MPNWCLNSVKVVSDNKTQLRKLYKLMRNLQESKKPEPVSDFGSTWLGCLVTALGENWKETACRGKWYDLQLHESAGELWFEEETAWCPQYDTYRLIEQYFPDCTVYYQAAETGCELFETNDTTGKYFPDKYYVEVCDEHCNDDCLYCADEQYIYDLVYDTFGRKVYNMQELAQFAEELSDEGGDAFISVMAITYNSL